MARRGRPTIQVRMDQAEIDALTALAAERGETLAVYVRAILVAALALAPKRKGVT